MELIQAIFYKPKPYHPNEIPQVGFFAFSRIFGPNFELTHYLPVCQLAVFHRTENQKLFSAE